MTLFHHPTLRLLAAILASAALTALYVRGGAGVVLGFVLLAPWLASLDASRTWKSTLLSAYLMTLAYTAAAFAWFGMEFGRYIHAGPAAGLAALLLAAPLFQPQILAFAVVRRLTRRRHGPVLGALAGASAWVATEWLAPKLLGDTLGHGLHPSSLLRQGADLVGAAGLSFMLLLANEGVAAAMARRTEGLRAVAKPLALAALVPLLLAGYGYSYDYSYGYRYSYAVPHAAPATGGKPLRIGLIQSNITDYEGLRRAKGAQAVVREVLDTHFAMSYDAVMRQHADAVLWSETVYPTTFGHPKSEAGAAFDRDILDIVHAAGVPFIFGTYDSDGAGEYNAAAFVQPDTGLMGFYRKTHLFPFTEYVPAWLDGPALRRALPWTGNWKPGNGARVFPLRLADGREIPVQALICRDDVDSTLAIQGARLGAQALLTMSNDSWFSAEPLGAQLHQAAAAFRSIETRLPQYRVTTNGYSAMIDPTGRVLAGSRMGERTLVVADFAVRSPTPTLMVRWGDWVGPAACAVLAAILAMSVRRPGVAAAPAAARPLRWPVRVAVLPPAARLAAGLLRTLARAGLLWMCAIMLLNDNLRGNTLAQIRTFVALFLAPEAAAWCLLLWFSARASIVDGRLVLTRGIGGLQRRRKPGLELAVADIAAMQLWRLPIPGSGVGLRLADGQRYALALARPDAMADALTAAGGPPLRQPRAAMHTYMQAGLSVRRSRLDHPLATFALLPFLLALPAFHLYQHIAYGSAFGEYFSFGLRAYLTAFALWWAAWSIGVVLGSALLRAAIEAATMLAALLQPGHAVALKRWLERLRRVVLYVGLPAWLLMRICAV